MSYILGMGDVLMLPIVIINAVLMAFILLLRIVLRKYARSLSGFALFNKKNAKKRSF